MSNHVQNAPNETVYARNLPYEVTEDEVAKHFEPAGRPTRIAFSKDRETGRFKGIAFVTFPSVDIAESAVRNLNQVPLKGREIFLDFSRSERGPRGGGGGDRRDRGGYEPRREQRDMGGPPPDGGDLRYGGGPGQYGGPQQQQQPQQPQPQQGYMQPYGGGPHGMPQMLPQPQGQPMVFAPQGMPGQQGSVVQQPTIILQADGRQVLLQPGQPLPAGLQPAPGGGMAAPQAAPGGGTLVQPAMPQMGHQQPQGGHVQYPPQAVPMPQARPKAPHELPQDLPVGQITAAHAGQRMADVLGDPQSAATPSQQQTSSAIASMSPKQLYQILKDLKAHIEADPQKGRDVLRQNLVLTKALFQAQILLGMLNPDATVEAPAAAEESKAAPEAVNGGPAVAAPAPQAAPANQQDMLRRVMALTPEAIAQLAPKDRAQVEAVREHIRVNNIQV